MIKDSIKLHGYYDTIVDKNAYRMEQMDFSKPIFNGAEKNDDLSLKEAQILDSKEKIEELENKLTELSLSNKDRMNKRIFYGIITSMFAGARMLASKPSEDVHIDDMNDIGIKLEKIARGIKRPSLRKLFSIGVHAGAFLAVSTIITSMFVFLGKENDKFEYKEVKQELANVKAKVIELET